MPDSILKSTGGLKIHSVSVDGEKYGERFDSGHVDSGFLSGTNLTVSGGDLEIDSASSIQLPVTQEPMVVGDSGVDLGLSDDLSLLSLKTQNCNRFGGKVQAEPIELTPVTTQLSQQQQHQQPTCVKSGPSIDNIPYRQVQHKQHDWTAFYMEQDDDGDTHLHNAICQSFLEVALPLIKMAPHPCLLDILNDQHLSPLHVAVLTRQARIVRSLVLAGANPALRDMNGNTPLHLACTSGDLTCARALTDPLSSSEKRSAPPGGPAPAIPQDLEQRNYQGQTCLHAAVIGGHVELVRLLLRNGADLEAGEWLAGRTALHLAIERHRTSVTKFLLQECAPCLDALTYAGITAYQIAACGDLELARELVRLGAKPQPPPESDSEDDSDSDMDDDSEDEGDSKSPVYNVNNVNHTWQGAGLRT
ncbi:NF-kappa-B inhibitor cactus [Neodiprion lecontei]|uniref:NF-kappa-B inhibitor cactus n=1 Tax=Neodiprion lecontei TaxID=441921 RepID=A0ABM3FP23_NEOLC|nr:NF-kappa-B inhibitor cactus [Neodiprion lecontei]